MRLVIWLLCFYPNLLSLSSIGFSTFSLLIRFIVVGIIFVFKKWYVGEKRFEIYIIVFASRIFFFIFGDLLMIVAGWEGIGLLSFLLISFWGRSDSVSASVAAVCYNRFGDLFLLLILLFMSSPFFMIVALAAKSAIWFRSYWLPIAMEGPTPVSSLLHSSTIVVAGVYLMIIIMPYIFCTFLVVIIIMSFNAQLVDIKKIIAYSTSFNLIFICVLVVCGMYRLVLVHILLHAFTKAGVFIWSGNVIHSNGSQFIGLSSHGIFVLSFFILMRLPSILISSSKELLVVMCSIVILLVSISYSKKFLSRVGISECFCVLLLPLVLFIFSGIRPLLDSLIFVVFLTLLFGFMFSSLWR